MADEAVADGTPSAGENQPRGINSFELDALKETANIGTGNASIALSNIFKKKVNITLPDLKISKPADVEKFIVGPKEMVVGIYSEIREGMDGNIVTLMPFSCALNIAKTFLSSEEAAERKSLNEEDKTLLKKIGTAIYSSYLTALAKFFEKKITFAPPKVISAFGGHILDFVLLNVENIKEVLTIKLGFYIEGTDIVGDFILLFPTDSLTPLIANIRNKIGITQ